MPDKLKIVVLYLVSVYQAITIGFNDGKRLDIWKCIIMIIVLSAITFIKDRKEMS